MLLLVFLFLLLTITQQHHHQCQATHQSSSYHSIHPIKQQYFPRKMAFAFDTKDLWAIRIASASVTYFGFVAIADRPRGGLSPDMIGDEKKLKYLQVKESLVPNAGLGLYITQDLPRGTVLGEYPGVLLRKFQKERSLLL